jgi:hypothetical protein
MKAMGIEQRNGKSYYYEKKRVGNRVTSEYVGSGTLALLAQDYAEEKAIEREIRAQQKAEINKLDAEIDQLFNWINNLSATS